MIYAFKNQTLNKFNLKTITVFMIFLVVVRLLLESYQNTIFIKQVDLHQIYKN